MKRLLLAVLVAAAASALAACGEDSGATGRPNSVENPPPIELDGDPPYGPGIEEGESYDYVLYTHCGIEWAPIDGVWWRTDPLGVAVGSPPDGWANPHDAGTLAVESDDRATYTSDTGITVEFRRTENVEAPFACE